MPIVGYGEAQHDMVAYRASGTERAMQLGNRGPIRFTDDGQLHPEIAEACWRCGFYVFTSVLSPVELADIEADVIDMLDRCPSSHDATTDRHGRPALGAGHEGRAVPMLCDPGDAAITSRQAIHGSVANTSERPRVTINFGFHRRRSVLGVRSSGVHNPISLYGEAYIAERSRVIGWAIDARRKRFGGETPFVDAPNVGREHEYVWDDAAREAITDYNQNDLGI